MHKNLNLMLHCGAKALDSNELREIATPAATATHYPIPHVEIVDRVTDQLERTGFHIAQAKHGITSDQMRYFGMMQAIDERSAAASDDYGLVIGLRNSHDKSFPAGLAVGAGVFVCDNLSFSGEITIARRHTLNILRDLPGLLNKGMGRLHEFREVQDKRIACYKQHELTDVDVHDLIFQAADARIIGKTQLTAVREEWVRPSHPEFAERSAWSLFNAFTEIFKPRRTGSVSATNRTRDRSLKLHGLMDQICGLSA